MVFKVEGEDLDERAGAGGHFRQNKQLSRLAHWLSGQDPPCSVFTVYFRKCSLTLKRAIYAIP
jgi:hypothetical protein